MLVSSHVLAEVAQTVDQVGDHRPWRRLVTQSTLAALTAATSWSGSAPPKPRPCSPCWHPGHPGRPGRTDELVAVGTYTETVGKAAAAAGIVIYEMRAQRSNLEDVFLQLTNPQGASS